MEIVLIAHNIRSAHNVGSILRTAEGFGVKKIYLTGYTPQWFSGLPHIKEKVLSRIHKTALGAEEMLDIEHHDNIEKLLLELKKTHRLVGLEQDKKSISLQNYRDHLATPYPPVALLLGEEVHGITPELRNLCDDLVEIPMYGRKESFNISVATGIALYELSTST